MEPEDQLALVRKEILNFARTNHLVDLIELNKLSDYRVLMLVKETTENADEQFQEVLRSYTPIFIEIVTSELEGLPNLNLLKWDDLILWVEWKAEIKNYLKMNSVQGSDTIEKLTKTHREQFDVKSIQQVIQRKNGWVTQNDLLK